MSLSLSLPMLKRVSRIGQGLRATLAVAAVTGACLSLPATPASAATSKILIQSGAFRGYKLCASAEDQYLRLEPLLTADALCSWRQWGGDSQFTLYNPAKDQVMAYTGGNEGLVVMEDPGTSPLGINGELWSWGGEESWSSFALQSFSDSGQNVDAKSPDDQDLPRTDPVRTRGWRHGYQRELTWNPVTL
ncbi:hypothetical protein ACFYPT_37825 [Streptomyces sp. NPDC005529]|uniref:hypothetical protein n=1 Tax=unclassified Streptomyces TaxID=2593676 RepID=UPI0033B7EFAE